MNHHGTPNQIGPDDRVIHVDEAKEKNECENHNKFEEMKPDFNDKYEEVYQMKLPTIILKHI